MVEDANAPSKNTFGLFQSAMRAIRYGVVESTHRAATLVGCFNPLCVQLDMVNGAVIIRSSLGELFQSAMRAIRYGASSQRTV